jgi:hypothetical protein
MEVQRAILGLQREHAFLVVGGDAEGLAGEVVVPGLVDVPGGVPWSDLDLVPAGASPVVPLGPLPLLPGACAKAAPADKVPARAMAVMLVLVFIDFSLREMTTKCASDLPAEPLFPG